MSPWPVRISNTLKSTRKCSQSGTQYFKTEKIQGTLSQGTIYRKNLLISILNTRLRNSPKFGGLVRRCLVDDLRTCEMDSKAAEEAKVEFMDYIQSTWIDGQFSPEMWSCFGRKSDHTNNCQEAYNAVLNRSLFVCF